jgi:WD40 repeat protein
MAESDQARPSNIPPLARVFISYARADLETADQIDEALRRRGFEPLIDRAEIYAFEDWWKRIEELIVKADAVVFLLSPASASSGVCAREVAFAASLGKRLAPIVIKPVNAQTLPAQLRNLNYISFENAGLFETNADMLSAALSTNIDWVRKHTEISEQARRWSAAGRPGPRGLLLRSPVLEEAEHWLAMRPITAPMPTGIVHEYIAESRRAAVRRRNVVTAFLAAGVVVASGLAGIALWQRSIAVDQRELAEANEKSAIQQRNNALLSQSRFLADLANRRNDDGDAGSAVLLSLEALPDTNRRIRRPYAPEAESALYSALRTLRESSVLSGHTAAVRSVAFSSDSTRLLTASTDQTARIWDIATGKSIIVMSGHTGPLFNAAFNPDGQLVATTSEDRTARIWNSRTGELVRTLAGHDNFVFGASFDSDGKRIVTSSRDGTARIWDVATGTPLVVLHGHSGLLSAARFLPDDKRIITSGIDKQIRIWDAEFGKTIRTIDLPDAAVLGALLAVSPDGRIMASALHDNSIRIADIETGNVRSILKGHELVIFRARFSSDGKKIITSSQDGSARLWDVETGNLDGRLVGHTSFVFDTNMSPDGRYFATASDDHTIRMWETAQRSNSQTLSGHEDAVTSVAYSADGRYVLTGSADRTARIWAAETGQPIRILHGHGGGVTSVAFSRDGKHIITASQENLARIWNAETGYTTTLLFGHKGSIRRVAFSPDGRRAATASTDTTARIWDIETGATVLELKGHSRGVLSVAFSADGRHLLTTSSDNSARIWDTENGQPIVTLASPADAIAGAEFSPDGRLIVTNHTDGTGYIWDVASGRVITRLTTYARVRYFMYSAAFSPDGKRIVSGSLDKTARIWDVATGQTLAIFSGHSDRVLSTAFAPDGKHLVTGANDRTARIWPLFKNTDELIEKARIAIPRCLTEEQRSRAFLDVAPPSWCTELNKWPYDGARSAQ